MNTYIKTILSILLYCHSSLLLSLPLSNDLFKSSIRPIDRKLRTKIEQFTWHQGCPVPLSQLVDVQLSYWGFDKKIHTGHLIVNKELAGEVVILFKALFKQKFSIQQMKPVDEFKGNDKLSMEANNTSAFNCRPVTGRPGEFSQHSYGRAIDINPLINPYTNGKIFSPSQGVLYKDRRHQEPGKILKGDPVYQEFIKHGWDWAGNWYDIQDYQHFEKRANGEKRNPYGY